MDWLRKVGMMHDIHFMATLTHDKHEPAFHGFCLYFIHDEDGNVMVQHNGLEYIKQKDIQELKEIVKLLECIAELKEN